MEGLGVTTESIGYLLLSAVSATVAGPRASQWHDRPESRTVTVVSALFSAGYLLANPRLRGFLASDAAAEHHLANWANVVGDSLATAASVCLIANIARAWGVSAVPDMGHGPVGGGVVCDGAAVADIAD